jgi:H+/Cl- antiporter ClcA
MRAFLNEHHLIGLHTLKWIAWGSGAGLLAGIASAIFLTSLSWATQTRLETPALIYSLPLVGFALGWGYQRYGGAASRGNHLVIEEIHANRDPIPLRMAPMILVGTVLTHLVGGSAGREGTALQMGASLADGLGRWLGLRPEDRPLLLMAGISGGFGSVFGTPIAGFVFGLEVQSIGRIRYEGLLPCLTAAIVGDLTTRALGVGHSHYPLMAQVTIDPLLLVKVLLAGVAFGLTSLLFIELTELIKHWSRHWLAYAPWRPVIGGFTILALTALVGHRDYLGLSLPLIQASLEGREVLLYAFLLKLLFTAVTLGTGFLGGEVTPLFVMGATLGYTMGHLLGIDPTFSAAIGFVAVFAGATNTPLACILMGVELFGGGGLLYLTLGCFTAYLASGHRSIYSSQRLHIGKAPAFSQHDGQPIGDLRTNR